MYDERVLRGVGRSAAWVITDQTRWIHRRVETITFPSPDDVVVRRRLSIDFTIPPALRPATQLDGEADGAELAIHPQGQHGDGPPDWTDQFGERALYYVPLSVLRKWPPVPKLDLRIGSSDPIPLLTRKQNGVTDAALLTEVARQRLVARGRLSGEQALHPVLAELILRIATQGEAAATVALGQLRRPGVDSGDTHEGQRLELADDPAFLDIAGGLLSKTILWLRVVGKPHERHIVKFAYDARVKDFDKLKTFSAAAFGWEGLNINLEVPHIGNAGSYHLQFSVPAPMTICDAQIELTSHGLSAEVDEGATGVAEGVTNDPEVSEQGAEAAGDADTPVAAEPDGHGEDEEGEPDNQAATAGDDEEDLFSDRLEMSAEPEGRRAHFYVTGPRPLYVADAKVTLLLDKEGPILGAFVAALLITALMGAYWVGRGAVVDVGGAAFGLLFLVPGLLAYLVVRPGQHAAAGRLFKGVKLLVLASGLLPLLAAVGFVLNGDGAATTALCVWLLFLAALSALNATLLGLSAFLPRGANMTPLTSAPANPDAHEEIVADPPAFDRDDAYHELAELVRDADDPDQLAWLRLHAETVDLEEETRLDLLARIDAKLGEHDSEGQMDEPADTDQDADDGSGPERLG